MNDDKPSEPSQKTIITLKIEVTTHTLTVPIITSEKNLHASR